MTSRLLAAALFAVALAGCAHHGHFRVPDPTRPQIVLTQDYRLVVNQEPIVIVLKANEPNLITWRLPPASGLTFDPQGGITILGQTKDKDYKPIAIETKNNAFIVCGPGDKAPVKTRAAGDATANGQAFTCAIDANIPRGIYTYEINVTGPKGRIKSDPSIMPL